MCAAGACAYATEIIQALGEPPRLRERYLPQTPRGLPAGGWGRYVRTMSYATHHRAHHHHGLEKGRVNACSRV